MPLRSWRRRGRGCGLPTCGYYMVLYLCGWILASWQG